MKNRSTHIMCTISIVALSLLLVISLSPSSYGGPTEDVTGFAGGDGSAADPYQISNVTQLQNMSSNLSAHYVLINDIDASNTSTWNGGSGFDPVGDLDKKFIGSLDGRNHTISNLMIVKRIAYYVGLFGFVGTGGKVENIGLVNIGVNGRWYVGGLVGSHEGTVNNCYANGTVSGYGIIGGLVGYNLDGTVKNCYATGTVSGDGNWIGGLVGQNSGTVENCYSTENVSGNDKTGGLVGYNSGTVENCYATGNVSGEGNFVGGLVGLNYRGGLVGLNYSGTVENCFWEIQASGTSVSSGGTGKNTSEMKLKKTFTDASWDFTTTWDIVEDASYPFLQVHYFEPVLPAEIDDATEDEPYSIMINSEFFWFPGCLDSAKYTLLTDCQWLSIAPSGLLSGTPSNKDVGVWWVNVTVTDLLMNSDTLNFPIEVLNVNDLPVITDVLPVTGTVYKEGKTIVFSVTTTDEDGDALTITWKDGNEVLGTGSPFEYAKLGKGEHVITVVVDDGTIVTEESFTVKVTEEEETPALGGVFVLLAMLVGMAATMMKRKGESDCLD